MKEEAKSVRKRRRTESERERTGDRESASDQDERVRATSGVMVVRDAAAIQWQFCVAMSPGLLLTCEMSPNFDTNKNQKFGNE